MRLRNTIIICAITASMTVSAKVRLQQIVSDGMIVQRDAPVTIWGTADPGETVEVTAVRGKKGKSYKKAASTAVAGADGRWSVQLPAMSAGSTYTLTVNDLTVNDVVPGDVYLCSGQSNMELPVYRVMDMFADEIQSYSNPEIRHFFVPNDVEFHQPLEDVKPTGWKSVTPDDAMNFSALGYFFAKSLYEKTGVPVGIIKSCWGGTPVEAWISEESIKNFPRAYNQKQIFEDDAYREHIKKLEGENYARWEQVMDANDPGLNGAQKWYAADLDDSKWEKADLFSTHWATDGLNPVNGSHWFRKHVSLPAAAAGKPGVLRMGCIVDADSVWVNGVFVGNITYQYPPRIYKIPEGVLKGGDNTVTVRLISQNGIPHYVREKPYKIIVDSIEYPLQGYWAYHQGTPMVKGPDMEFWCYKPVVLYNAMIHPLAPTALAGVVWYQGESNVERRNEYSALLKTMISDWRRTFDNAQLPFYIVELANFLEESDVEGRQAWAEMRTIQAAIADETEGAYIIKNYDLGEWNDIHPLNKKTLGERIAAKVLGN